MLSSAIATPNPPLSLPLSLCLQILSEELGLKVLPPTPSSAPLSPRAGAIQLVLGDISDSEAVARALPAVSSVVCAVGSRFRPPSGDGGGVGVERGVGGAGGMRQMGVRAEWTSTCCHEDADRVRKAGARAVWMLPSAQHCRVTCSSAAVPPTDGTTISVGNTTHLLSLGNLHKAVSQTPAKWEARRQSSTQWLCNPARFPLHHTTLADT